MKIITLKQPWATLVANGIKKYEFRTWKTNYRGELLIHAGKGIDKEAMSKFAHLDLKYPQSKILAKVTIVDCIELSSSMNEKIIKENEVVYGNKYDRTGYAWVIDNAAIINHDAEISGKLGLWNIDFDIQE